MSQPLDRGRPLWEMWFAEGLEHDRFALIIKTHHCMIDGIAGADSVILDAVPDSELGVPPPWTPRPRPSDARLIADEIKRRLRQPVDALQAVTEAAHHPETAFLQVENAVTAIAQALSPALTPASPTPLNVEIGPSRRFDWTPMLVADYKALKNVLGGTLNDVVLATVSGAVRRFFLQRGSVTLTTSTSARSYRSASVPRTSTGNSTTASPRWSRRFRSTLMMPLRGWMLFDPP